MKITNLRSDVVGKSVSLAFLMLILSYFAVGDVFANNLSSTNYAVSGTVGLLSLSVNPNLRVDVNAESLPLGPITTWINNGTSGGSFGNNNTSPTVRKIAGRKAVVFDGSDRMQSTFGAPSTITGTHSWTVCVWAYNPEIDDEECMVQWANKGAALKAAQFNYGSNPNSGAVNHYGGTGDMGYGGGVPAAGQWHHIALTYTGGTDGTETVYVDGQYNYSGTKTLNLYIGNFIKLANATGSNYFSGSIASVQMYSYALSLDEIKVIMNPKAWNPSPQDESEGIDEPVTLQWSGRYQASWHDVYFGSDKTAVSNANNSTGPCDTCIYRARLSAANTSYAIPEQLQADATYYWRIDELDSGGSVLSKGTVWSFTVQGPKANSPEPSNGAKDSSILLLLNWKSGTGADRHNVFFGDNYNDVLDAECLYGDFDLDGNVDAHDFAILAAQWLGPCGEGPCADVDFNGEVNFRDLAYFVETWLLTGNGTYKGSIPTDSNSFYPGLLSPGKTYYWRIDEVNFTTGNVAVGTVWSFTADSSGDFDIGNNYFNLQFDALLGGFTKMFRTGDSFGTQFILGPDESYNPGWLLGDILMKYRIGTGSWQNASTYASDDNRQIAVDYQGQSAEITITYPLPSGEPEGIRDFDVNQRWVLDGNSLRLDVNIVNTTGNILEIGDLGFRLPFNTNYDGADTDTIQTKRVIRHGFFSGHGSHSYWTRVNGVAPFLVMTTPSPDTRFEYWDNIDVKDVYFTAYAYSSQIGGSTAGNWRQQHTSKVLQPGQNINLKFNFTWADSLNEVRDALYADNDLDIQCVPGMTVPQDLYALVKIRTKELIDSIQAEYPADTNILYVGEPLPDTHIYKVRFNRLGENILRINHNGSEQTILEMFSCEPLETLFKKRASHMVNYEQVKNPSVWYDGLFGEWDLRYSVLRDPNNTDGMDLPWWIYVICCDDPGNSHAPYLAGKNVRYPVQAEITALEYYIQHYLWGGLQYTDAELYPYGVFGVPTWYYNRTNDPEHISRAFDYPHIVMLYYHMYQIAKYYPDMVSYLDRIGYLYRAYNTAMVYYWFGAAWTVGTYNEVVYADIINSLREEGLDNEAYILEYYWEWKAKYFIFDKEYPYGSEYAMDSTAFESTHALVKWAMENGLEPDSQHPVIDPCKVEEFMHGQMKANLAVRGCIEPAFYTYGSDYRVWGQTRYTLSYMSQMGGWAVLDYGLNFTNQPMDYIRLGYGSYLSSWALMNSDPTGTNGYWYPAAANDGAIGWAFHPEKTGPIWLQDRQLNRGIWYYNGEIDLGLCGALRCGRAIVVDDPIFGLFGYGCQVSLTDGDYAVVLKDGLREWLIMYNIGIELKLNRDSFKGGYSGCAVVISSNKDSISFTLDNERPVAHTTTLTVKGLIAGTYSVKINSVQQYTVSISGPEDEKQLNLSIGTASTYNISVSKI